MHVVRHAADLFYSLLIGLSCASLVPRPIFPTAAASPLRGKWVWEIRTNLFRASQNIETDVYIRNDADVT